MTLNYTQKRLIVLIRKRAVTDTIAWLIVGLLTFLYIPIHILSLYEPKDALLLEDSTRAKFEEYATHFTGYDFEREIFTAENWFDPILEIATEAGLYTFALMIMVYLNLNLIKKVTLDRFHLKSKRYGYYLVMTLIAAIGLGILWENINLLFGKLVWMDISCIRTALFNFAFALISTGLFYLKEVQDVRLKLEELNEELEMARNEEKEESKDREKPQISSSSITLGTQNNWRRIKLADILYLRAEDNGVRIFMEYGEKWDNNSLKDFAEMLPDTNFLQIHRSYIINVTKVVGREKNEFVLQAACGKLYKEPKVSNTYLEIIETYPELTFEQRDIPKEEEIIIEAALKREILAIGNS